MNTKEPKNKKNNELFEATRKMVDVGKIASKGLHLSMMRRDEEKRKKHAENIEVIKRNLGSPKDVKDDMDITQEKLHKIFNKKSGVYISKRSFNKLYNYNKNKEKEDKKKNKEIEENDPENEDLKFLPTQNTLMGLKQFLNYNQNLELIFLSPESEANYEQCLFLEIMDKFNKKIIDSIEEDCYRDSNTSILDQILANYSGSLESKNVVKIIKISWNRFFIEEMLEEMGVPISQIELFPYKYSKKLREEAYSKGIELIKMIYSFFFYHDDIYKFSVKGKRLGSYNQIEKLSSGKIQKVCIENVLRYVETISDTIKASIENPELSSEELIEFFNLQLLKKDAY